eukprot:4417385-Pleurochrysis_carterae.AAC.2
MLASQSCRQSHLKARYLGVYQLSLCLVWFKKSTSHRMRRLSTPFADRQSLHHSRSVTDTCVIVRIRASSPGCHQPTQKMRKRAAHSGMCVCRVAAGHSRAGRRSDGYVVRPVAPVSRQGRCSAAQTEYLNNTRPTDRDLHLAHEVRAVHACEGSLPHAASTWSCMCDSRKEGRARSRMSVLNRAQTVAARRCGDCGILGRLAIQPTWRPATTGSGGRRTP